MKNLFSLLFLLIVGCSSDGSNVYDLLILNGLKNDTEYSVSKEKEKVEKSKPKYGGEEDEEVKKITEPKTKEPKKQIKVKNVKKYKNKYFKKFIDDSKHIIDRELTHEYNDNHKITIKLDKREEKIIFFENGNNFTLSITFAFTDSLGYMVKGGCYDFLEIRNDGVMVSCKDYIYNSKYFEN